ncbi:hypothetical protein BVC80_9057g7 [Macleaya cordata]|uniref:Uncharacterized protein n=1 Tax=Macleaya cordata TaxID=56857 RepID=A0A200R9Q1_MACCD|nr:hypothetical protein BVC80_9057g7 [Macleaya cordata]
MAEKESKSVNTSIEMKEEQKNRGPLFSIFQDFKLNFPLFKRENKEVVVVTHEGTNKSKSDEESNKPQKPDFVKLPDSRQDFSSLKLSVEESEQGTGGNHLWQFT